MPACLTNRNGYRLMLQLLLVLLWHDVPASPPKGDSEMLFNSISLHSSGQEASARYVSVMQVRQQSLLARYNPITLTFSGLMYVYQRFVSPQLPSSCLYEHSCSSFSRSLIAEYGLAKGIFTTADRLMRCNRMAAIDIHPLSIGSQSEKLMETIDVYKNKPE